MVQLVHKLVEETETQHRQVSDKFHYDDVEQIGKDSKWLGGLRRNQKQRHLECWECWEIQSQRWEEKETCMCAREQKCVPLGGVETKCGG